MKLLQAHPAQIRGLAVDLLQGAGAIHQAAVVAAVQDPEHVHSLVQNQLCNALEDYS